MKGPGNSPRFEPRPPVNKGDEMRAASASIHLAEMKATLHENLESMRRRGLNPYGSINDAARQPGCECLAPGEVEVLYLNHCHPESTGLVFGPELFTKHDLESGLWVKLGTIKGGLNREMIHALQGEVWSPNGEACGVITRAGALHTSFSPGDGFRYPDGRVVISNGYGLIELPAAPEPTAMGISGTPAEDVDEISDLGIDPLSTSTKVPSDPIGTPCVGGEKGLPLFDMSGERIHVGDTVRVGLGEGGETFERVISSATQPTSEILSGDGRKSVRAEMDDTGRRLVFQGQSDGLQPFVKVVKLFDSLVDANARRDARERSREVLHEEQKAFRDTLLREGGIAIAAPTQLEPNTLVAFDHSWFSGGTEVREGTVGRVVGLESTGNYRVAFPGGVLPRTRFEYLVEHAVIIPSTEQAIYSDGTTPAIRERSTQALQAFDVFCEAKHPGRSPVAFIRTELFDPTNPTFETEDVQVDWAAFRAAWIQFPNSK